MRRSRKPLSVARRIEGSNPSPSVRRVGCLTPRCQTPSSLGDVSRLDWWWSPHPSWEPGEEWDENVPVVRIESDDEVVLIDPFLPPDDSFDPRGKPVRVLLTQGAHYRGTPDFVERYAASVWAPPNAWWPPKLPNPSTTTELPDGIDAIELDGEP